MKENNGKRKIRNLFKDKRVLFSAALACAALILAIVFVVSFAEPNDNLSIDAGNINSSQGGNSSGGDETPDTPTDGGNETPDAPTVDETGMVTPVAIVSVSNDYGFFYNQTLNCYYHHDGLDFIAEAGAEVVAAEDGTVESIYTGDLLSGTEIVIDHGNGVKTLYRFVEAKDGLQVGDSVEKGEAIATVAEANGDEYKDGAHLHFEILENGEQVDPAKHLTLEEK